MQYILTSLFTILGLVKLPSLSPTLTGLKSIKDMPDEMLSSADLGFSTSSITGQVVQLSSKYSRITPENKREYVSLAIKYR